MLLLREARGKQMLCVMSERTVIYIYIHTYVSEKYTSVIGNNLSIQNMMSDIS